MTRHPFNTASRINGHTDNRGALHTETSRVAMFHHPPVRTMSVVDFSPPKPALCPAHALIHRAVEASFADFLEIIELGHEAAAEFIELLTNYQARVIELAQQYVESFVPESLLLELRTLKEELDAALLTLLGPGQFQNFEMYRMNRLLR
jgi:hypothetical protein